MVIYQLGYAQDHLAELFEEARNGEDVIVQRSDGRRCQLVPVADVKDHGPIAEAVSLPELESVGIPAPA